MVEASIPVDLLNPGQVFACLGFLEAADELLGDAEGGFDWSDKDARVRFLLRAAGDENPFAVVLKFLAEAQLCRLGPIGYSDPPPKEKKGATEDDEDEEMDAGTGLSLSESFPDREGDRMALPIRLVSQGRLPIALSHWADGSRRKEFKLYAGNRSAHSIARAMLRGKRKKPTKAQKVGDLEQEGIEALWNRRRDDLTATPFDVLTLMGGSFNFDPRGAWTALGLGFSLDQQRKKGNIDGSAASPVVEILAAMGLEHARPDEYETRQVRYAAWGGVVPPILARPALAGANAGVPVRRFRFALELSGKNKVVTFAQEETTA